MFEIFWPELPLQGNYYNRLRVLMNNQNVTKKFPNVDSRRYNFNKIKKSKKSLNHFLRLKKNDNVNENS